MPHLVEQQPQGHHLSTGNGMVDGCDVEDVGSGVGCFGETRVVAELLAQQGDVAQERRGEHVLRRTCRKEDALDCRAPPDAGSAQWRHQQHAFVRPAGDADRKVVRLVRTDSTCQQQFDDLDPPGHRRDLHQLGTIAGPGEVRRLRDRCLDTARIALLGKVSRVLQRTRTDSARRHLHGGSVPRRRVGVHEGVGKGLRVVEDRRTV